MSKLAQIALMVMVLVSTGCSSMGMGSSGTTSGSDISRGQEPLYSGGVN